MVEPIREAARDQDDDEDAGDKDVGWTQIVVVFELQWVGYAGCGNGGDGCALYLGFQARRADGPGTAALVEDEVDAVVINRWGRHSNLRDGGDSADVGVAELLFLLVKRHLLGQFYSSWSSVD